MNEIECLVTMVYTVRRTETVIVEALLGRIKGVEVRFRDGRTPLGVLRADPAMTNAEELIEALLFRMSALREIEPEIIDFAGRPLVRNIHWRGETPALSSGNSLKLSLACLMFLALLFGSILGLWGRQEHRLQVLGSVTPQEIPLQDLVNKGPRTNPHVTLVEFQFGGYVMDNNSAWIALFPRPAKRQLPSERLGHQEIRAVLRCDAIPDEAALQTFLQKGRVTGLCSGAPTSSFGATLGPMLTQANPGSHLGLAWSIEELDNLPSADRVRTIFLGSKLCFALVIVLGIAVYMTT